jgi:hypothetical protein
MNQTNYGGFIFTNHAVDRLYQRGIAQSDAWYTMRHPDGTLPGTTPGSYRYYKDYGNQRIEVVAKLNDRREWVVLSCWSKEIGNGQAIFPKIEPLWKLIVKFFWKRLTKKA